jgi:hypothetical protein
MNFHILFTCPELNSQFTTRGTYSNQCAPKGMLLHLTKGLLLPSAIYNDDYEEGRRMVLKCRFPIWQMPCRGSGFSAFHFWLWLRRLADIKFLRMTECLLTYGLKVWKELKVPARNTNREAEENNVWITITAGPKTEIWILKTTNTQKKVLINGPRSLVIWSSVLCLCPGWLYNKSTKTKAVTNNTKK